MQPLPIDTHIPPLLAALRTHGAAVVSAPPGSGKTTRIPPAIARDLLGSDPRRQTVLLQPRRVAARAAARRIAAEQRWSLGREIGWQIRFENRTSPATFLRVATEGILTRQLLADPLLESVGCVILDEFHERSIHTDLAVALLAEVRAARPDLHIVVMSATLDAAAISAYLGGAAVIACESRPHPVAVDYLPRICDDPVRAAADAVRTAVASGAGHILVFLPGIGMIRQVAGRLADLPAGSSEVHLLHSSVSAEDQDRALAPSPHRKIILATNIAETSLTIEGVATVIDTGLERILVQDPRLGIERLDQQRISLASAEQRAGRAGRTGPGRCLRLWTTGEHAYLRPAADPDIRRIDLAGTLLALHEFGIADPRAFGWFEPPPADALDRAESLLRLLDALDAAGRLTPVGRRLAALPLHPRLGRLLIAGAGAGLLREAATMAAILSESTGSPARTTASTEGPSDLLNRLNAFESSAPRDPESHAIARVRDQLLQSARDWPESKPKRATGSSDTALLRLPLAAWPDRLTARRSDDPSRGRMAGGRGVRLEPASVVRRAPLFLSLDPRNVQGESESRVTLASAVEPEWLAEVYPHLLVTLTTHAFDPDTGRIASHRETRFIDLVIDSRRVDAKSDRPGAEAALAAALATDPARFLFQDPAVEPLLNRINFLARHCPELALPALSDPDALAELLAQLVPGCLSLDDVLKARPATLLLARLTHPQRAALDSDAPTHWTAPSGSRIRIDYSAAGDPVVAVRLQEMFGLPATPRLARNRAPVLLHLLGPNFRPVQITRDLENFWRETYAQVRAELRARYPKHAWPEDPTTAPPQARGRHRNQ